MLTLDALDSRRSTPTRQLGEPGPDAAQLLRMLQTAVRVPDHGKRVPFRFLRIAGSARTALADAAAARLLAREPEAGDAVVEKLRTRFTLPPLTVAVIARLGEDPQIPASERFSTAACVCLLLLQAAQAEGYRRAVADRLAGLRSRFPRNHAGACQRRTAGGHDRDRHARAGGARARPARPGGAAGGLASIKTRRRRAHARRIMRPAAHPRDALLQ